MIQVFKCLIGRSCIFDRMKSTHLLNLILVLTSTGVLVSFVFLMYFYCKRSAKHEHQDVENSERKHEDDVEVEDLMTFQDGQDLTICDILDAPGEVIGKSNSGTLYKALLQSSNSVRLLRFLRPVCTARVEDFGEVVQLLGCIRHPNLVPLLGFYAGPRGEKLLIHPFYWRGNLAQFVSGDSLALLICFLSVCLCLVAKKMYIMKEKD